MEDFKKWMFKQDASNQWIFVEVLIGASNTDLLCIQYSINVKIEEPYLWQFAGSLLARQSPMNVVSNLVQNFTAG